jgi:hypothetical protein
MNNISYVEFMIGDIDKRVSLGEHRFPTAPQIGHHIFLRVGERARVYEVVGVIHFPDIDHLMVRDMCVYASASDMRVTPSVIS